MIRFYSPDIKRDGVLPPEESVHCVKVLRHRVDDVIEVTDGAGCIYICKIVEVDPRQVKVKILSAKQIPNPWEGRLIIAVAPPKNNERLEWASEKLTEIGVDEIVPIVCQRSERKVLKAERLQKVIVSATKQSLKTQCPVVHELEDINNMLKHYASTDQKFIAYCDDITGKTLLAREIRPGKDTVIVIGPEGDFTPREVESALALGYKPVSLGECRLRTETAAIVAATTFHVTQEIESK